ncbi:MAG: hypothetical protein LKH33_04800 [Acetobacter sp.]|jgi:hypothetical protein|nr:hypothetical protein [Acetobacter sp.]
MDKYMIHHEKKYHIHSFRNRIVILPYIKKKYKTKSNYRENKIHEFNATGKYLDYTGRKKNIHTEFLMKKIDGIRFYFDKFQKYDSKNYDENHKKENGIKTGIILRRENSNRFHDFQSGRNHKNNIIEKYMKNNNNIKNIDHKINFHKKIESKERILEKEKVNVSVVYRKYGKINSFSDSIFESLMSSKHFLSDDILLSNSRSQNEVLSRVDIRQSHSKNSNMRKRRIENSDYKNPRILSNQKNHTLYKIGKSRFKEEIEYIEDRHNFLRDDDPIFHNNQGKDIYAPSALSPFSWPQMIPSYPGFHL